MAAVKRCREAVGRETTIGGTAPLEFRRKIDVGDPFLAVHEISSANSESNPCPIHRTLTMRFTLLITLCSLVLSLPATAQDKDADKPAEQKPKRELQPLAKKIAEARARERKAAKLTPIRFASPIIALTTDGHQLDCPAFASGPDGQLFVAYLDHDGSADQLKLARRDGEQLVPLTAVGEPGVVHQPALAVDAKGTAWCFWGQLGANKVLELRACPVTDGKAGKPTIVAATDASESFAEAGVDSAGRVWVAWQSMRNHRPDIYTRVLDPETQAWSDEIRVSTHPEGDWEPALSFDRAGNAWIAYDSAAGNEFNLYLARVNADGTVKTFKIAHSPQYEARADLTPTADGSGFWLAAERGKVRWGLDSRGHANTTGCNARKSVLFGRFDIASGSFETIPLGHAGQAGAPVNLPAVGVDANGRPWVSYRYFGQSIWRIGMTRYDPESKAWTSRRRVELSSFGQDRRARFASGPDGRLWHAWTSDLRSNKTAQEAGIYLAAIAPGLELPNATPGGVERGETLDEPFAPSQETPERAFDERHSWSIGGQTYKLYWGDVHRHTDVSNCRTGFDGCIAEHFRYAFDMGKLDFMGTSDHTDVGKIYDPYEWWHNQKMHDAFHAPGKFNTLYVYEREQRWPWGHRNVVFGERGGPVVYIQRKRYLASQWQAGLPVEKEGGEISPYELWDVLQRSGKKVAVVSHTGATGMGTDWGRYDKMDYDVETLVEIFQGARVAYEGDGAPQPTAGQKPGQAYMINGDVKKPPPPPAPIAQFGKYGNGTYQNALRLGRRLGVFASSDHISSHVSYGGVYVKEFTRAGIIEGLLARRTLAATDKIHIDFTCNGQALGSIMETAENPRFHFKIEGTGALKRVTLVRNEGDWKVFDELDGTTFETEVRDPEPGDKENRYYLRVEQQDGNMAWSSPVWVTRL